MLRHFILISWCLSFLAAPAVVALGSRVPSFPLHDDSFTPRQPIKVRAAATVIPDKIAVGYEKSWPNGDDLDKRILSIALPVNKICIRVV
jgi:hypothetical protein